MEEEERNRTSYIRLAREAVRKRREKVAVQDAKDDDTNKTTTTLTGATGTATGQNESKGVEEVVLTLLRNRGDELDIYSKLQRLIEKNASDVEDEVNTIRRDSNLIKKRILGYTQLLNADEDNNAVMMGQ